MTEHPHDSDHDSRRPEWWNGISTGNVLTILVMLGSAVSVYAMTEVRIAKLEVNVEQLATDNIRQDTDAMRQADKLDERFDKIDKRLDDILAAMRNK